MDLGLGGKSVLVVASSSGLGRAVAVGFGGEGCRVTLCARSEAELANAAAQVEAAGGMANPVVGDITDATAIESVVGAAAERFGGVDVLVTNCGGPPAGGLDDVGDDRWEESFQQVFLSVPRFIRGVLPHMRGQKWGRIVAITSASAKQPLDNLLISNSLRPGITGFLKSVSNEVAVDGITVNSVAPTFTRTERLEELVEYRARLTGKTREAIYEEWAGSIPAGRLGKPEELADLVLFLASERAAFITGSAISFDGGAVRGL